MRIEKERNNIYYYREDGRRYRYDTDTGIMYSLANEPMQSRPKILTNYELDCITREQLYLEYAVEIKCATECYRSKLNTRRVKPIMELLAVVKNYYPTYRHYMTVIDLYNVYNITGKDLSVVLKYWKENYEDFSYTPNKVYSPFSADGCNYSLYDIYRIYQDKFAIITKKKAWGIMPKDEFSEEMSDYLYGRLNVSTFINLSEEKQKRYAEWFKSMLFKGHWNMYKYGVDRLDLKSIAIDIIKAHEDMGIALEKTNNPFRYYAEIAKTYKLWKQENADKMFAARYEPFAKIAELETEHLCIVLPKSAQDLTIEGQRQHNCVGGYDKMVTEGSRIVFFVRQKSDKDKNYITCDFHYHTGSGKWILNQYLYACNNSVRDAIGNEMRDALTKWVSENINKI